MLHFFDSSNNELTHQSYDLETRELAKHRLRYLKSSYKKYFFCYNNYLKRHYLIIAICSIVILFGIIIVLLKFDGKENLLYSFKVLQSSFASLSSGAGIIAYGSDIFFPKKKARANESKDEPNDGPNDEPKAEVIRLSIERNLGEKLDRTTNKLRDKRHDLEKAMSWLSIWAIFASIIILLLVGIDFFGLLPDIKYLDIGLDLFLSITGAYCLFCTHTLKTVLTSPRGKLESSHLILFVFVIPCASLVGLLDDDVWIGSIIFGFFAPCYYKGKHWVKEVYLSPDEKVEIQYLLHGLNPDLSLLRINKFCKEFILENPANESKSKFVEKVNEIESKSKKEILYKHFELGKALVDHIFSEAEDKSPEESVDEKIVDIVKKFSLKSFFFTLT